MTQELITFETERTAVVSTAHVKAGDMINADDMQRLIDGEWLSLTPAPTEPPLYSEQYAPSAGSDEIKWQNVLVERLAGYESLQLALPDIDWATLESSASLLLMRALAKNWAQAISQSPQAYDPDSLIEDLDAAVSLLCQWRDHAIGLLQVAHKEVQGGEN